MDYLKMLRKLFLALVVAAVGLTMVICTVAPTPFQIVHIDNAPGFLIFILGGITIASSVVFLGSAYEIARMVVSYRIREVTIQHFELPSTVPANTRSKFDWPRPECCHALKASNGGKNIRLLLLPGQVDLNMQRGTKVELAYYNSFFGNFLDRVYKIHDPAKA